MNYWLLYNNIVFPILFCTLLLGVVVYLLFELRRLSGPTVDEAEVLGFEPLDPSIALIDKVADIVDDAENPDHFELLDVTHKRIGVIDCYLLDIRNTRYTSADQGNEGALVIFSPRLHLPRFTLITRPKLQGVAGALLNPLLNWLPRFNRQRVAFSAAPEFERRYLVTASDPNPVIKFFTPALLDVLGQTGQLYLRASGNGFICSLVQTPRHTLEEQLRAALMVYDAFTKLGAVKRK